MKKLLITLTSLCLLGGIAMACGCENNTGSATPTYGKKYLYPGYINDKDYNLYYIFNKDGTGIYADYEYSTTAQSGFYGYIINFDYKISGNRVVCTYNSVAKDYDKGNDSHYISSSWYQAFEISEDFLFFDEQYGTYVYICEDYLESIPEFNK